MKHHRLWRIQERERVFSGGSLTLSKGVVDAEAAQNLIDIAGVEESISSHHHLEGLWVRRGETQEFKINFTISLICGSK